MNIKALLLATVTITSAGPLSHAQSAPSLFFDKTIPSSTSTQVELFRALKAGKIGDLYIQHSNTRAGVIRPSYKVTYVDDFQSCAASDERITLRGQVIGYKLSAGLLDDEGTVSLFMEEPLSANLINGECLLARRHDVPDVDFTLSLREISAREAKKKRKKKKSGKNSRPIFESILTPANGPPIILERYVDISGVLNAAGVTLDPLPRYRVEESNIGKVSDENIIRALKSDNNTMKQVALYLLNNRDKRRSNEFIVLEDTKSPEVLSTLLGMPALLSPDEGTRTSVLNAIGVVMKDSDSSRVKTAVLNALEAPFPVEIEGRSREFANRFGIEYVADGTQLPGVSSAEIRLGAALPIFRMTAVNRAEIQSKHPQYFETLSAGLYKDQSSVKLLRNLMAGPTE